MNERLKIGTVMTLIVLGILLTGFIIYKLAALVILVLVAIVLTNGIDPLVQRMQLLHLGRWYLPRGVAAVLVLLFAVTSFIAIVGLLVVTAIKQGALFIQSDWPILYGRLGFWLAQLHDHYEIIPTTDILSERLSNSGTQIVGYLWSTSHAVIGFLGGVLSLVLVGIFTLFFTIYKESINESLLALVPIRMQTRVARIAHHMAEKMGGWLRGQLLMAFMVMVLAMLIMMPIMPKYAVLIGIVGGIGELIPMVGPSAAFYPALAIALATGANLYHILALVILFVLLTQFENYVIMPLVMKHHLELSPITSILAVLSGAILLGIFGALLAVPLTAAGRVILLEVIIPAIQGKPFHDPDGDDPSEQNLESVDIAPSILPSAEMRKDKRKRKRERLAEPIPPTPQEEALQHIARLGTESAEPVAAGE